VDRFRSEFGRIKFTTGSQPFLKLFTFHACVNADELLKKNSEASERLIEVLESIGDEIGFSTNSPSEPARSYARHMQEIGVRTNYITGTRLSTIVARIMGEKLGTVDMNKVIYSLVYIVRNVVKEIEKVMGYTSFKEAKLIQEYKKLDELIKNVQTELARELPDVEKASKQFMSGLQELKRFHKAIFLRVFGDHRLRMLQDQIAHDAVLDEIVPKILPRFANVPLLSKYAAEQLVPNAQPVSVANVTMAEIGVASGNIDPAIPMAVPLPDPVAGTGDLNLPMAVPLPDPVAGTGDPNLPMAVPLPDPVAGTGDPNLPMAVPLPDPVAFPPVAGTGDPNLPMTANPV
jgi:cell division protein ZapA (FtsZ GTPase activity inhibitor)